MFSKNNEFRRLIYYIQKHKYFDNFIMLLIALSSAKLALESYLVGYPNDHPAIIVSKIADNIFTFLFLFECIFKIIAIGLIMDSGSYLRESWNDLDFFIVTTSMLDLALQG